MEQLGFNCTNLRRILYIRILLKSVENIQVRLKSDKNSGYFRRRPMHVYDISLNSSSNENCFRENENTNSIFGFFSEDGAAYVIMW